jgi:ribosome biogenesis GTPase / thiamine phosphate phosphatase
MVVSVHGQFVKVRDENGREHRVRSRHKLAPLASGDLVEFTAERGSGSVEVLHERHSLLVRTDSVGAGRPVAANIDLVLILWAPVPQTPSGFIDRYLVNLELQSLPALLVGSKFDRVEPEFTELRTRERALYAGIGYDWIDVSSVNHAGLDELSAELANKTAAIVGQSGVGKSSLVNALSDEDFQAVGPLTQNEAHGTHTTSATRLLSLANGCTVIDSPGVREFATGHLRRADLASGFPEMREHLDQCRFRNCLHRHEPDCAVQAAVAKGTIDARRMLSYQQMLAASVEFEIENENR